MKTWIFLLGIIFASGLLLGCSGNKGPVQGVPFIGGSSGVVMNLKQDYPPAQVFDNGETVFGIIAVLKNDGEFTVPTGEAILTISGIDATDFSKTVSDFKITLKEPLRKKEKSVQGSVIESPEVAVEIGDLSYKGKIAGDFTFPLRMQLCYLYGTTAIVGICVKEDLLSSDEGTCTVAGTKTAYNSGAPIQIENFIENPSGKEKIRFSFDIVKKGNGDVFRDTVKDCTLATPMQEDEVFVEVGSAEMTGITCGSNLREGAENSGYVRLNDMGKATVDCAVTITPEAEYVKQLPITLKYRYQDYKPLDIIVKHAPTDEE
jgi:hypothetical protein